MEANGTLGEDGKMQLSDSEKQDDDLGDGILEDLDSYLQDINDRLTISRMVSDSVIKGMVNAISQEAEEIITLKELEVAQMKEIVHSYLLGSEKNKYLLSQLSFYEPKSTTICGNKYRFSEALFEHDEMRELMESLKNTAKKHFKKLRKEIDRMKGCSSLRKINSGSELVGLSGILPESLKCTDVDKTVDELQDNLNTFYRQVEGMVQLSKASFGQWRDEQEFLADIEGMVVRNYIRSVHQEFEEKLWEQNAKIFSNRRKDWAEKIKEISSLRQELDTISKSLSPSEVGHLISYSSMDSDHSHRKGLSNHMISPTLLWEENGKHELLKTNLPENVDPARLKHLTKEELINHFNTEMTKMSRNHESQVQKITEETFTLKRELLKEKEKSSLLKKEKEFEILRKRIPDIILKLDDILLDNEKLRASGDSDENLGTMRSRLESLISENRHLKDSLEEKKKEVKCLSSQVSSFTEKMSQYSLLHTKSLNLIEKMKSEMQDAEIKASIGENVVQCFLRETMDQIGCVIEESALANDVMQGIYETIYLGAASSGELTCSSENEDLDEESIIMQCILGITFQESLKEAEEKMTTLNNKYVQEMRIRLSLEKEVLHCGEALRVEVSEKERLEGKLISAGASLEEKEQLVREIALALQEEKAKLASASEEIGFLRDQTNSQETVILKGREESNNINLRLSEALQKVELLEAEACESKQKFGQAIMELNKVIEERRILDAMLLEHRKTQVLVEEKETEGRKQMESVIFVVQQLSKEVFDFERSVIDYVSTNNKRLESLSSQSKSLIQSACTLKRDGVVNQQRLEKRCSDLQKAEAEVDLLGDEVDALLRLLEKIYIALDHYSPILQHYPGIVEILKLVKRELSGDTMRTF